MTDVADAPAVPRLYDGDRMNRQEFHRRYEAMGPGTRAELIEGIAYVYSASECCEHGALNLHASPLALTAAWIGLYGARTSQTLIRGINATVLLDHLNEPQPDVLLGIPASTGGQTRVAYVDDQDYVEGAPELVVEISASTARADLNAKLQAYARNGVREYLVVLTDRKPTEVRLMTLDPAGEPTRHEPDGGLLKSRVFPGLWLDPAALLAGKVAAVLAAVDRGTSTDEHAAFARRLSPTP